MNSLVKNSYSYNTSYLYNYMQIMIIIYITAICTMCVGYIFLRITTLQSSVTAGLLAGLLEAVRNYHHDHISHVENNQCIDAVQHV